MKKLSIIVILLCAVAAFGQKKPDTVDFGIWNDIQITHALNKTVDVVGGVRFDTKNNTEDFAEQRVYAGFNFKQGSFTISPALVLLRNFAKVPYYETRPQLTLSYKTAYRKLNISPKVRLEYHAKQNLKNDSRIIPIISFDRKISKHFSLFNTDEFWIPVGNSRDVAKYRKRLFYGVTRNVNKHLSVDIFYLYQRDEQVNPKNFHKLGFTWKIKA